MHLMSSRRNSRSHKKVYFYDLLVLFQFPTSLRNTDMRLMDTKHHLSTKRKPERASVKVQL